MKGLPESILVANFNTCPSTSSLTVTSTGSKLGMMRTGNTAKCTTRAGGMGCPCTWPDSFVSSMAKAASPYASGVGSTSNTPFDDSSGGRVKMAGFSDI